MWTRILVRNTACLLDLPFHFLLHETPRTISTIYFGWSSPSPINGLPANRGCTFVLTSLLSCLAWVRTVNLLINAEWDHFTESSAHSDLLLSLSSVMELDVLLSPYIRFDILFSNENWQIMSHYSFWPYTSSFQQEAWQISKLWMTLLLRIEERGRPDGGKKELLCQAAWKKKVSPRLWFWAGGPCSIH